LICNDVVADFLENKDGQFSINRYEGDLVSAVEAADYKEFHSFADCLEKLSRSIQNDEHTHRDISLVKMNEVRWIWPLVYNCVFSKVFCDYIKKNKHDSLKTFGANTYLSSAARAARSQGIDISAGSKLLSFISREREYLAHSKFAKSLMEGFFNEHIPPQRPAWGKKSKPRMLIVGNYDRTIERFIKILPYVVQAGFDCHIIGTPCINVLKNIQQTESITCSYVQQWVSESESQGIKVEASRKGSLWWKTVKNSTNELDKFEYSGINLLEQGKEILQAYALNGTHNAMYCCEVGHRILNEFQPDVILNFEDAELNRAITLQANNRKIPTVAYYCLSATGHAQMVRRTQGWMAVAGQNLYDSFVPQYTPKRIRIVGDPLVEPIESKLGPEQKRALRIKFGLDPEKPCVLLMSTYPTTNTSLFEIETIFKRTFKAIRNIGDVQLVIKAHPRQILSEVRQWVKLWGITGAKIFRDIPLIEIIKASDMVSACRSSSSHQMMLAGVPIVSLQSTRALLPFESMGYDYLAGKGIVHIDENTNAEDIFRKLLFNEDEREKQIQKGYKHAEEHVGPLDGNAGQRFVEYISYIMSRHRAIADE